MEKKPSVFDFLSPGKVFLLGMVGGLLILGTIGFFVMLAKNNTGTNQPNITTSASQATKSGDTSVTKTVPPTNSGEINIKPVSKNDWIRGNKDAKVAIIEFSDLECPFCKRFHPTMQQVMSDYGDKVAWIYRHFPLDSLHPKARKEAEATECAGELGGNEKFWSYVDRLFEITPSNNRLELSQLSDIAQYIGLDKRKFDECLNSGKYASKIQDHYQQAIAAGGRGTPYSVVIAGDQKIPVSGAVPFEQLKAILDPLVK